MDAPPSSTGGIESLAGEAQSAGQYLVSQHPGLISIVIPAYNEEETITRCVQETHETMRALGCRFEIVVVDDGSSDETLRLVREATADLDGVHVVAYDENEGKGKALVQGAYASHGDLVLFMDADLEVHPRQLSILYHALVGARADISIGSKLHRQSTIDYPLKRRILSRGYYWLVKAMFRLPVRDTQTGLKLYRREVLMRIGPRLVIKHFAHDLEVLVNARRLGYRIVESPVVVTRERDYPRVGAGSATKVALDTAAIWYRTYVRHWYDRVGAEVDRRLEERGIAPGEIDPQTLAELDRIRDEM
jgi:glycosyltransferase involved in cell wall biosynthesis